MNRRQRLQEIYECIGSVNLVDRRRTIVERAVEKMRTLPQLGDVSVFCDLERTADPSIKRHTEIVKISYDQMITNVRDIMVFEALLLEAEAKEQRLLDEITYLKGLAGFKV